MAAPLRVLTVFGTRPEAIKMAPVLLEFARRPADFDPVLCVSAQHREMLDQVLDHFGLRPQHDLNVMTERQTLTGVTVRVLEGLDRVLERERPDLVLVHGDTATTFAAALAAFYRHVPVGHVEAGLRTGDRWDPYPEEMSRRLTDTLAELLLAPTPAARDHLLREGMDPGAIHVTGNTAIDALFLTVRAGHRFATPEIAALDLPAPGAHGRPWTPPAPGRPRVVAVELHRRENWGEPLERLFGAVAELARSRDDVRLVASVHRNPAVSAVAHRHLAGLPRVLLHDPLPYPDWVNLVARCHFLITDSGGNQEEAPSVGCPVLVCRVKTERPEAVTAGTVKLVGTDGTTLLAEAVRLLDDAGAYEAMSRAQNPYGDGQAARRTADAILHRFGRRASPPDEFLPRE